MKPNYWLLKTEPETYSFTQLLKDKKTNWNNVRNYQARNNLKLMAKGDLALIYHSGDDKSVVGLAEVVREAYPDPDPEQKGEWFQIDIKPRQALSRPVQLAQIKATHDLLQLPLIKQSRLSVMPISPAEFERLVKMGSPE